MLNLNRDILYLIFDELQDDKKTLYSCLRVNKTWCEIIIRILWKNPWKFLNKGKEKLLLNVIISHLTEKSRNNLKIKGVNLLINNSFKRFHPRRLLYNYITYCRHLNLKSIEKMINSIYKDTKKSIIKKEIFDLFINKDMRFTHLYIPKNFNHQINLIPGVELCLSKIGFLSCSVSVNNGLLDLLIEMCTSIKDMELVIDSTDINYEIIKLIENQKRLINIRIEVSYYSDDHRSFYESLESSLIKHANTIQLFRTTRIPVTKFLSSFVNLKILELNNYHHVDVWKHIEDLSFPRLQNLTLKISFIPINALTSLIESTSGCLNEIIIDRINHEEIDNKRIIQTIYQNCPNLKYLKLTLLNNNILELKNLLINCQYLNGLYILNKMEIRFNWNNLFDILIKSSPTSLFKFKFDIYVGPKFESLKLFFNNWKGRRPMLLQTSPYECYYDTDIKKYREEKIIEKYVNRLYGKDFDWI
jgi:hypothetical protein